MFGSGSVPSAAPPSGNPQVRSIDIQRPNIVIRGAYLDKVEVWAVPTGTGITPDEFVLLGNATRRGSAGGKETWLFPIPVCPTDTRLLATEIFVKGFDAKGALVEKNPFRMSGPQRSFARSAARSNS